MLGRRKGVVVRTVFLLVTITTVVFFSRSSHACTWPTASREFGIHRALYQTFLQLIEQTLQTEQVTRSLSIDFTTIPQDLMCGSSLSV